MIPRLHTLVTLSLVATFFTLANGHGTVSLFGTGSKTWIGPMPNSEDGQDTPVRIISTLEPIMDPMSKSMACGPGARDSAQVVAEVKAGSTVTYGWRSGAGTPWVHRWGPVMLYAYKCPGSAADCAPPTDAQWFLINAAVADPNASDFDDSTGWVQDRFKHGKTVDAPVPNNMPNGDYLLRHEIIALHNAISPGAEYYVSCTQVKVSGGISGSPKDAGAELVALPGAYGREDPGIRVNVFGMNLKDYVVPGPKVFGNFEPLPGDSDPDDTPSDSDSGSGNNNTSSDPPTSPPTSNKPVICRLRAPKSSLVKAHERRRSLLGIWPVRSR